MITFFIRVGEREYTGPPSVFMDETTVERTGSVGRKPVQPIIPMSVTPTQHAPTTSTDDVEWLEKKIDDLQTKVGHLTAIVRAIMQHRGVEVSGDYFGW